MIKKMENEKPIKKFISYGITLSIWKNEKTNNRNEKYISYSIKIQKRYVNENNEWKTTDNFSVNDLPRIRTLSEVAYQWLTVKKSELKQKDL